MIGIFTKLIFYYFLTIKQTIINITLPVFIDIVQNIINEFESAVKRLKQRII